MSFIINPAKYEHRTPGSWEVKSNGVPTSVQRQHPVKHERLSVCNFPPNTRRGRVVNGKVSWQEMEANAALIADAPDLLKYCIELQVQVAELLDKIKALENKQ